MTTRRDQGRLFAPDTPLVARTRRTTDQTIAELRRLGRLEDVQVGLVAMLRTVADQLDAEVRSEDCNRWTVARLAAEWRAVHAELRGQADTWDDQLTAFFEDATGPDGAAAVRDAT